MRIIMLSWEYPPANVGGLARHGHYLSRELARRGNLVEVITQGTRESNGTEETPVGEGILRVHRRSAYTLSSPDFLHWVHQLNYSFLETVMGLQARPGALDGPVDVVHAHDWLVAFAARAVKHALRVPMVATIHATEAGRHHGIHNPWQRYISEVEWWLTYEAWRVICCSGYMESELAGQFQLPPDKIRVIPNGIDLEEVDTTLREAGVGVGGVGRGDGAGAEVGMADGTRADELKAGDQKAGGGLEVAGRVRPRSATVPRRDDFAQPGEDIVFFVGRLVREKGVDTLLDAFPAIIDRRPATRLVIAGTGPHEGHLRWRVSEMGLGGQVTFAGYTDDRTRNLLYHWAAVAVVPSYYEPFGLTALEAMAAGCPLVVSDTGGLSETIVHNETGMKVPPANPGELAGAVLGLLSDSERAARLVATARAMAVDKFSWTGVAAETEVVYDEVIREAQASGFSAGQDPPPGGEDWEEMRQRTRVMTRGMEPIGRYNPPS